MKKNLAQIQPVDNQASAAVYSRLVLSVYDLYVIGFSCSFAWRCPSEKILAFYNRHISSRHLDVGVGTGYYLDKCRYPAESPFIALADLNRNSLEVTAKRLQRYNPVTCTANVLETMNLGMEGFDSIGINFLLHCLPGTMTDKGVVFRNLRPLLGREGVVFGTTILGQGVRHNLLGRTLTGIYNKKGIFGNMTDNAEELERILKENFSSYTIGTEGCVAFFTGRI